VSLLPPLILFTFHFAIATPQPAATPGDNFQHFESVGSLTL